MTLYSDNILITVFDKSGTVASSYIFVLYLNENLYYKQYCKYESY